MAERATPKFRADWKEIVTKAKGAQGRWVLGLTGAPIRVMETVNRRASNRWLNDPDGRLYGIATQRATTLEGEEICDVYVRWEWFNPAEAPRILVGPEDQRTLRVPRELKVKATAYSRDNNVTLNSLINDVLKRYVRYGTRLKPAPQASEQLRATVPEDLWTKALFRAEQDGMPLVEIVRYELGRKLR